MPRTRETIPGTSIASTSWGASVRVYFQDANGGVRESKYEGAWSGGTDYDRKFGARLGSPLAIVKWMTNENCCIRLYCLDKENAIQEHCCDGAGWFPGSLTCSNAVAAPYSKLAAVRWPGNIRLYYQEKDDTIWEQLHSWCGWHKSTALPVPSPKKPLRGTSIASVCPKDNNIYVYFQTDDGSIQEVTHLGKWSLGSTVCEAKPYTPLAAVQWVDNDKTIIHLYCLDKNDVIQEYCWDGSCWLPGSLGNHGIVAAPCSKLAPIRYGSRVLVYYQPNDDTRIYEYCPGSSGHHGTMLTIPQPPSLKGAMPIDTNGSTYPVGFLPWIYDWTKWRDYDPSEMSGVRMIIGFMDGRIIGEELKTKKIMALEPNPEGTSYTWIYTPDNAIIYILWKRDNGNHAPDSEMGSKDPLICAGEFVVNKLGRIDSIFIRTNEGNGSSKPKCLGSVVTKFGKLGVEIGGGCWCWHSGE